MSNKIKSIFFIFLLMSTVSYAAPSTPQKIERACNQQASKEEGNFEKNYLTEMERYNKKKYEINNLINPEKRINLVLQLSSFCKGSFHASNYGLEKDTFRDYVIEEFEKGFNESDLDNADVAIAAVLLKPIFIRMIDYGYTLSEQE